MTVTLRLPVSLYTQLITSKAAILHLIAEEYNVRDLVARLFY